MVLVSATQFISRDALYIVQVVITRTPGVLMEERIMRSPLL